MLWLKNGYFKSVYSYNIYKYLKTKVGRARLRKNIIHGNVFNFFVVD